MLGKQWLNRYASTDLRGSAIERSQNRQRKLDGIVAWYFDHVMEFLPLMLQAALLLLGCALTRYLFGINVTVASIILGVTSFGVIFYIALVVAGAAFESCPYQTPGSYALRYIVRRILFSAAPRPDGQTTALDSRCVSWMLETSLDKDVRLSTLKHLSTIVAAAGVDPTLVVNCFNALIGCVGGSRRRVIVVQGSEQLAVVSALALLNILSHLLATDPASRVLGDLRRRYTRVFSDRTDFDGHQFRHTMNAIHCLFVQSSYNRGTPVQWSGYKPSAHEHTMVSHNLACLAQSEYRRMQRAKVPRWILHFSLHSLSMDPLPPTPVIADCLSIIVTELGYRTWITETLASDERYVCT